MPHWTNLEQRRLIDAHRLECPTRAELVAMFPRHSSAAVLRMACQLGLHRNQYSARWRRIALDHLKKRDAECGASRCCPSTGFNGYLTLLALLSIGAALHELHQWRKEIRMANNEGEDGYIGNPKWWGILALIFALILGALIISGSRWPAYARDLDGRFQHAENHEWFKSLHASGGHWCCDISDGHAVADVDWRSRDGHYQVNLEDQWVDVPEDALIKVPNIDGRTFVWPGHVDGKPIVNCFMPGSMT